MRMRSESKSVSRSEVLVTLKDESPVHHRQAEMPYFLRIHDFCHELILGFTLSVLISPIFFRRERIAPVVLPK